MKTVETKTNTQLMTTDIDRLGKMHGKVFVYDRTNSSIYKEYTYVNTVLQWSQSKNNECVETCTYTCIDGDVYKSEITEYHDGECAYVCYKNNLQHGLTRLCGEDGAWSWFIFKNGYHNGLFVNWYPNGTRHSMGKMKNDRVTGTHYRWSQDGVREI